jgi:2-polyprenyl-3-methyl-5-hydroxy-6-metoxy-1,4-benzoquinol methylase
MSAYLGLRLGLYEALRRHGPVTAAQLAGQADIDGRYAQEWLEQQAAAGIVDVDDAGKPAATRIYTLPAGHAEALTDPDSPYYVAPLAVFPVGGIAGVLPQLLDAYRTGTGVRYAQYGTGLRGGQGGLNRSVYVNELAGWIRAALPHVHDVLSSRGGRIADIACGSGWSSIALARAYPQVEVDGFDADPGSVEDACANAASEYVADRVHFSLRDAAEPGLAGRYDLVCILDALHDMARPVDVLRNCRELVAERGAPVLLMEPRVAEVFTAPARDVERFMHAVSLLHCLPAGRCEQPSAATGAMIRPSIVRAYASQAGFTDTTILPVQHTFHRLYRLLP